MERGMHESGFETAERDYQRNIVDCFNSLVGDFMVFELANNPQKQIDKTQVRQLGLTGVSRHHPLTETLEQENDWYLRLREEPQDEMGYQFRKLSLHTDTNNLSDSLISSVAFDYNPDRDDFMLYEEATSEGHMIDWLDILRTTDLRLKYLIERIQQGKPTGVKVTDRPTGEPPA